jgi:PKD repeat protein
MKKIFFMMLCAVLLMGLSPANAADYGGLTLNSPWTVTHWNDVWDLTQGDLILSYTIDMTNLHQPGNCSTYDGTTLYAEVGLRGEGAGDFNPGPFGVYQGRCGGWMTSDDDTWNDVGDGLTERCVPKDTTQDLDDKHCLAASGGRGDRDYDVLDSDGLIGWDAGWDVVGPTRQDPWYPGDPTKVIGAYGSFNNVGIWWDRDGVDPYQSTTYANTLGIYQIEITYHAIDAGLGVMFATVNGLPQGFYSDPPNWNLPPDLIPAGLSFKGDMKHMQVFAGVWGPNNDAANLAKYGLTSFDYGSVTLSNITVTGTPGVSDPLVAGFNYAFIHPGFGVQFTNTSHGGMPPYTYAWDFGDGGTSTDENPTHTYAAPGNYTVKLTVTPFRCVPQAVTQTFTPTAITLASFTATPRAGRIIIQWNTESEIDNAGFNIYRASSENGEYVKVNDALISSEGSSTQGASYVFIDRGLKNGKTYYYKLEDMDRNGTSTMHGPVSATPRWIFRIWNK